MNVSLCMHQDLIQFIDCATELKIILVFMLIEFIYEADLP